MHVYFRPRKRKEGERPGDGLFLFWLFGGLVAGIVWLADHPIWIPVVIAGLVAVWALWRWIIKPLLWALGRRIQDSLVRGIQRFTTAVEMPDGEYQELSGKRLEQALADGARPVPMRYWRTGGELSRSGAGDSDVS